jgi:hypothetical protein
MFPRQRRFHAYSRVELLVRFVRWLFGGDDGCAGVFARLKPGPPTLKARATKRPPCGENIRKSA